MINISKLQYTGGHYRYSLISLSHYYLTHVNHKKDIFDYDNFKIVA